MKKSMAKLLEKVAKDFAGRKCMGNYYQPKAPVSLIKK
jgi:cyclic lactone autoinducer peptide